MPHHAKRARQRYVSDAQPDQRFGARECKARHNRDAETDSGTAQHCIHLGAVEHHPWLETGAATELQGPVAQLIARRKEDKRFVVLPLFIVDNSASLFQLLNWRSPDGWSRLLADHRAAALSALADCSLGWSASRSPGELVCRGDPSPPAQAAHA
jgi:hypothetical protein